MIGRGSSGVVKKVLHNPSGAIYVLKVINFDMGCEQVRNSSCLVAEYGCAAQPEGVATQHNAQGAGAAAFMFCLNQPRVFFKQQLCVVTVAPVVHILCH